MSRKRKTDTFSPGLQTLQAKSTKWNLYLCTRVGMMLCTDGPLHCMWLICLCCAITLGSTNTCYLLDTLRYVYPGSICPQKMHPPQQWEGPDELIPPWEQTRMTCLSRKQLHFTSTTITTHNTITLYSFGQTNLHHQLLLGVHLTRISNQKSAFCGELSKADVAILSKRWLWIYGASSHRVCIMFKYWPTKTQWPKLERAYALQRCSSH